MSDDVDVRPDLLRLAHPRAMRKEPSGVIDLTELAEEVDYPRPPPSLVHEPSLLFPAVSGLHSSLLSTSAPLEGAETWEAMVEELAEESRKTDDPALRAAMLCEAGRILIERLGRQEDGELLLRRSESAIADVLRRNIETGTTSLAGELAALEAIAKDENESAQARAAAWIEFGQLCEDRTPSRQRALDAYRRALALVPDHPVALSLAAAAAAALGDPEAEHLVRGRIAQAKASRERVALLLQLSEVIEDPEERLIVLEQAHQAEPGEETALRRLSRALSTDGDPQHLGELYRELAAVAEDPISASTALHLAFLTLAESGNDVSELVLELAARDPSRSDSTDVLAPLAEVALHVEQHIAAGGSPDGLPENIPLLERLVKALDDPREQALVREQLARIRLGQLERELAERNLPGDDVTLTRAALEERAEACDELESDLRFCLVHLPEHRWVREALASLLEMRGNMPALVLHLQEWARTQTAGPGRAAILLRLGRVHEQRRRDLARAAEIYELAVAEDPDNPNCLRALGHVYERMRRWPQAVASLRRQADETDDIPERLAALRRVAALAEHELGDVDLAIASLEEVARLDPDDLMSLYQLATLSRASRRPTVLITALEALVGRVEDPVARTSILVELGEVQELQLKRRSEARSCYEKALELTPGYTPALRALSRLYRDNGDLDELIRLLSPEVDTVTDPAVLALKAARVCLDEMGDAERALEHLWNAYRTNPDLVPARELLLQQLTSTGRIRDAYDLLRAQEPPKTSPLRADHEYRLGLLAEACARHEVERDGPKPHPLEDAALQHYRLALAFQPDHGLAFERARRLLIAHHDLDNLTRLIETLTQSDVEWAEGERTVHQVHLGRLRVVRDDTEAARLAYEEALGTSSDDPIVRRELEALLRLSGDRKSLPALYLRAARDTSDTHLKATLLVEAAELLLSTGQREDHDLAGKAVLEALEVDPGNPYAVRHLERLLSEPDSSFVIKDAVSARAVRAQSEAERAIFYVESAELLERVGAFGQARRAYLAAKGALPHLAPADLGLQRTASAKRGAASATSVRTSIHVLVAEARDAAIRAGRGDVGARTRALQTIREILQRDPQHRDALALARSLAGQLPDPKPVLSLLTEVFGRIENFDLKYELGLFLGEHVDDLEEAIGFYQAASAVKPNGRRALRGLVNAYRQKGDDRSAAAATEKLLALFEPSEPSAIDLRMGIATFLASNPDTLERALEHAKLVVDARPDDVRALGLMADLLERAGRKVEAAALLDKLAARERSRERLHDIALRRGQLLAAAGGHDQEALAAIEKAAALNPGNRDTVTLLVEQLSKTGQSARVATYLTPIRSALIGNVSRGAVSLRDLKLLAKVAEPQRPELSKMAQTLLHAFDPNVPPPPGGRTPATREGLTRMLATPSLRGTLYADGEPTHLHTLLQAVDGVVARLGREFPVADPHDDAPVPSDVILDPLREYANRLGEIIGVDSPKIGASSAHNAAVFLQEPTPMVRLGNNLWAQGDMEAWRGLIAVALARAALGAPRVRALSAPNLDLLLSACFEVADVFNPMTADPDPRRFKDLVATLRNSLPHRQRKAVEVGCQALATHAFDAGTTAKATTATDLHLAAIISGDLGGCLSAACLLDGVVGGTLKQRIGRSKSARELLVHVISDEFITTWTSARATS